MTARPADRPAAGRRPMLGMHTAESPGRRFARARPCRLQALVLVGLTLVHAAPAATRTLERNVVYGMVSGAALLLDVHHPAPATSRRTAIVFVPGSGWYADGHYDAPPLKDMASGWGPGDTLARTMVGRLVDDGFTVFVANHRAAPRFRYPAAIDDIARAVAFVRANATRFDVRADAVGGAGTSSGGSLVSVLGVDDARPATSRLDAVVTLGSPMDLVAMFETPDRSSAAIVTYLGHGIAFLPADHPEVERWREAGTFHHASAGDAPHLIVHGSDDELVPFAQAVAMHRRWLELGVESEMVAIAGGGHSERLLNDGAPWLARMSAFFVEHLEADREDPSRVTPERESDHRIP